MASQALRRAAKGKEKATDAVRPPAKTERTGFLHLPNEIRNRIYEDCIFHHDKGAVFLPRSLPRKVTQNGERVINQTGQEGYTGQDVFGSDCSEIGLTSVYDADDCHWEIGEPPPEEIPISLGTEESDYGDYDDDESVEVTELPAWNFRRELHLRAFMSTRAKARAYEDEFFKCAECYQWKCICLESEKDNEERHKMDEKPFTDLNDDIQYEYQEVSISPKSRAVMDDNDSISSRSKSSLGETQPQLSKSLHNDTGDSSSGSNSESGEDDNGSVSIQSESSGSEDSEEENYDSDGFLQPPDDCLNGTCMWSQCRFCAGKGLGPDQDETRYVDDSEFVREGYASEDPLSEDFEHFDSKERMGMLFQQREPGILLACTEIREQCLPIYYAQNAFSWRFFWLDQHLSQHKFNQWAYVAGGNAKHISQLSFEGRHAVEEGIEFEVDIDLLNESPFFDVQVEVYHTGDELTDVICEALEQDFITMLWRMSRRDGGCIEFSPLDLQMLGALFIDVMERDPGLVGDRGQWDVKNEGKTFLNR